MELRKKSILIALCLGDGYITHQKQFKKGKYYQYNYLEVTHTEKQKEYIEWKSALCRSITGKKCSVLKQVKKLLGNDTVTYRFTCTSKYFRVLRKWLYPNNKKKFDPKYISYLDEQGLAIWFMDDGTTYVSKSDRSFRVRICTHISKEDNDKLVELFQSKWGIKFYSSEVKPNQYVLNCYSSNALKFLKLIEPFVPDCMAYKLIVPKFYFHECTASHLNKIKGMKIYSEQ